MVVGTDAGGGGLRVNLGSRWSGVLHLHPSFLSLQRGAPQAGAAPVMGGSLPVLVPIIELGVLAKQAPSAAGGWSWTHRSCLRLT